MEAQGGVNYASYGDNLMKKWANTLMLQFGKRYNYRELYKIRAFYNIFKKFPTLSGTLSWSHIVEILPIKNANAINYYLNQVILNNISVRELREEIKSKAFERLSYADKNNIKLIENKDYNLNLEDMIKDPIKNK